MIWPTSLVLFSKLVFFPPGFWSLFLGAYARLFFLRFLSLLPFSFRLFYLLLLLSILLLFLLSLPDHVDSGPGRGRRVEHHRHVQHGEQRHGRHLQDADWLLHPHRVANHRDCVLVQVSRSAEHSSENSALRENSKEEIHEPLKMRREFKKYRRLRKSHFFPQCLFAYFCSLSLRVYSEPATAFVP